MSWESSVPRLPFDIIGPCLRHPSSKESSAIVKHYPIAPGVGRPPSVGYYRTDAWMGAFRELLRPPSLRSRFSLEKDPNTGPMPRSGNLAIQCS